VGATQLADPQHTGPQGCRSQLRWCLAWFDDSAPRQSSRNRRLSVAPVSVPFGGEKDSDAKSTGGAA
jgi:hypothetical protein